MRRIAQMLFNISIPEEVWERHEKELGHLTRSCLKILKDARAVVAMMVKMHGYPAIPPPKNPTNLSERRDN